MTLSSATAGAQIYYTTDGSKPTTNSTPYVGPVDVSATVTIKAIAIASGYGQSSVATGAYTIAVDPTSTSTPTTSSTDTTSTSTPTTTTTDPSSTGTTSTGTTSTSTSSTSTSTNSTSSTSTPAPAPTGPAYYVAHDGNDANPGTLSAPWRTLSFAVSRLGPGDTLYIRGGTVADTNTGCTGDNAQSGACWMETEPCAGGSSWQCSPLHWGNSGSGTRNAGTASSLVTIAAYPGETVILQTSAGADRHVVFMQPSPDKSACSYVKFDGLIFDNRNCSSGDCTVFRVDSPGSQVQADMCQGVVVANSKIRHGLQETGGVRAFVYQAQFLDDEIYENGGDYTPGDHDHGLYLKGGYNTVSGGRIHHNIQGVQVWDTSGGPNGYDTFADVEIDHNGTNPFNGRTTDGGGGDLGLYLEAGSYATVTGCNVHDNAHYGISVGAPYGDAASYVSLTNNHVWNNGYQSDSGCGGGIFLASGSAGDSCSGNMETAP